MRALLTRGTSTITRYAFVLVGSWDQVRRILMAGLTTEQVHATADELYALGVRPTLAEVRKKLCRERERRSRQGVSETLVCGTR